MLNYLQSDIRKLLDLVRKIENFDATIAASQAAGKPANDNGQILDISIASDGALQATTIERG